MKKLFLNLLVIMITFSLSACGSSKCYQEKIKQFLNNNSPVILLMAHPTASYSSYYIDNTNVLYIKYRSLFSAAGQPDETLAIKIIPSFSYKKISDLYVLSDTNKEIEAFTAVNKISTVFSLVPGLSSEYSFLFSRKDITPKLILIEYLNLEWKKYYEINCPNELRNISGTFR